MSANDPDLDPFRKSFERRFDAAIEFEVFRDKSPAHISELFRRHPRFASLNKMFGFHVEVSSDETVQASFGQRPMTRKNLQGKQAIEGGLTLLYSFGPTGDIAACMYPFESQLGKPHEHIIFLHIGKYTAYRLLKKTRRDVSDLIAYGHVTTLDGTPKSSERMRVWWLRKTRAMELDGKFTKPEIGAAVSRSVDIILKSFASAAFMSVLKPIGLVVAATIIAYVVYRFFGR